MDSAKWRGLIDRHLRRKHPVLHEHLLRTGQMNQYSEAVADAANHRLRELLQSMREEAGLPERPQVGDAAEWRHQMDAFYRKAVKTVRKEMIEF
ncbi:MAG: TnpV protein [Clostridia bacterium]|nr:TnpV protein [Clostridia bacterium]